MRNYLIDTHMERKKLIDTENRKKKIKILKYTTTLIYDNI